MLQDICKLYEMTRAKWCFLVSSLRKQGGFTPCFERELVVRSVCRTEKLMQRLDARQRRLLEKFSMA